MLFPRPGASRVLPAPRHVVPRETSQHAQHCRLTTLKETARERVVLAVDSLCVCRWAVPSLSKNRQKLNAL